MDHFVPAQDGHVSSAEATLIELEGLISSMRELVLGQVGLK